MSLKTCKNCNSEFKITPKDQNFYTQMKVAEPTQCLPCRRQRKFAFRNERCLYHRHCDLCKKETIAVFPAKTNYIVYCYECWWSDKWDPMSYAHEYDFNRPFFEQYSEFEKSIPHFALFQDGTSENCKYVNYGYGNKSCYLCMAAGCEDLYYTHAGYTSKSCMDCTKIVGCELCYECIDCNKCYQLLFAQDCTNCNNSSFLKDCTSCSNCFCSVGLRNQNFVFENQQLSEEEYKKKISEIKLDKEFINHWQKRLDEISATIPKKYLHGINNQNVTGDYLDNCKDMEYCFDCLAAEDMTNCDFSAVNSHNMYDCMYAGGGCESCYELNGAMGYNNCKFVYYGRFLQDCEYCQICHNSAHLFGCFGLNQKKFCIFNKQYTEQEYFELKAKIIAHMMSTKEYGEFFPTASSSFAYNESVAHEYYPLTQQQALSKGYRWYEEENRIPKAPEDKEILSCKDCGKNFKIINQEASFYQRWKLPVPEFCYTCRHKKRFVKRNPRQLWTRQCQKCNLELKTSYSPERPEIIYCEKCYLDSIA